MQTENEFRKYTKIKRYVMLKCVFSTDIFMICSEYILIEYDVLQVLIIVA